MNFLNNFHLKNTLFKNNFWKSIKGALPTSVGCPGLPYWHPPSMYVCNSSNHFEIMFNNTIKYYYTAEYWNGAVPAAMSKSTFWTRKDVCTFFGHCTELPDLVWLYCRFCLHFGIFRRIWDSLNPFNVLRDQCFQKYYQYLEWKGGKYVKILVRLLYF